MISLSHAPSIISKITALKLHITTTTELSLCSESKSRDKYNPYFLVKLYGISSCISHPSKSSRAKPYLNTLAMCCSYCNWKAPQMLLFQTGQCMAFPQCTALQEPPRTPPPWHSNHTMQRNTKKCFTHSLSASHLQLQRTKRAFECLASYLNTLSNYWAVENKWTNPSPQKNLISMQCSSCLCLQVYTQSVCNYSRCQSYTFPL